MQCRAILCYLSLSLSLFFVWFFLPEFSIHTPQFSMSNRVHVHLVLTSSKDSEKADSKINISITQLGSQAQDPTGSEGAEYLKPRKKNIWISQKDGLLFVGKEALTITLFFWWHDHFVANCQLEISFDGKTAERRLGISWYLDFTKQLWPLPSLEQDKGCSSPVGLWWIVPTCHFGGWILTSIVTTPKLCSCIKVVIS